MPVLLDIDYVLNSSDMPLTTRQGDHHELIYVLDSGYRLELGQDLYDAAIGDVFYAPPGMPHGPRVRRDLSIRLITLCWEGEFTAHSRRVVDADRTLLIQLRWLADCHRRQEPGTASLEASLLHTILHTYMWLSQDMEPPATASFSRLVMGHMRRDIHRPILMEEIAKLMDVSVYQLIRRFKREVGRTPGAWLQQERVTKAMNLLKATDLPLKTITEEVGIRSEVHLRRLIKRESGMSPTDFRLAKSLQA